MFSDYHVHSCFSFDCETPLEENISKAISLGMKQLCITDHHEFYWPNTLENATIDVDKYFSSIIKMKDKYKNQISVLAGVELGLAEGVANLCYNFIKNNPFDFVIGSCHLVDGGDPWVSDFWIGKDDRKVFEQYFSEMLSVLKEYHYMDSLGHLDFVTRYSPNKDANYSYFDYSDMIDSILKILIENDIKLEINTANIAKGFAYPNPHTDIIKRYKELGGTYVTIGSDAHMANMIGSHFDVAEDIVHGIGLKVYTK